MVKGLAGDALLDSCSDQRVAAAHENLQHGSKSTEFMAPPSFALNLMRRAVLGLALHHTRTGQAMPTPTPATMPPPSWTPSTPSCALP